MPTYEFRCPDGHDFEKFYRSIGAAPAEVQCPRCGIVATKLMSAGGGLVFKGSGFYITDYGKDGKKAQAALAPKTDSSKAESGTTEKAAAAAAPAPMPAAKPAAAKAAVESPKTKPAKE
ncbi:MAG: zinc ribbon domain-containing protein [Gemmatimonadaceae bacterium]|nr:zinc ribbon domain-containing protein [Gemmatimonadaceae bacterium]